MSEFRNVGIRVEDIQAIEDAGYSLYRAHEDTQALALHALALRLRAISGFGGAFECDVDESAGMAEIVDLHDFSKKVS